jgi:hypothetical protein
MTLRTRTSSRLAVLLAVPAMLLALAACSAAPGSDSAGSPSSGSSSSGASDRDAWALTYAQCLRDNGIDAPDPDGSGQGAAIKMDDAYKAASQACEKKVGTAPPFSTDEKQKMAKNLQEAALKAAKCYRDNGIDVPDPSEGQLPSVPSDVPQEIETECGFGPNSVTVAR